MSKIEITRVKYNESYTSGNLKVGNFSCLTMERPDINNMATISCIPKGVYKLRPYADREHSMAIEILGVPNRAKILIHTGNQAYDTRGGIIVAKESVGAIVAGSKQSLVSLLNRTYGFGELTIK